MSGAATVRDREQRLLPLRRAKHLTACSLYWLPAPSKPPRIEQKQWLMSFFDELANVLSSKFGLRPELFLQLKVVYPNLMDVFIENMLDFNPLLGLTLRPGTQSLPVITEADVKDLIEGRRKFEFGDYVADYAFWFVGKQERKQRDLFLGLGGLTTLFLKPDEKTTPPDFRINDKVLNHPAFKPLDLKRRIATTYALSDSFRTKSKELFWHAGLQKSQVEHVPFIVPLLQASDFFAQPQEVSDKWFQLFDAYVNESPTDRGILIACKADIEEDLISILQKIREQGIEYDDAERL